MVKDTGSRYFEGAYFVLRSDLSNSTRENDMMSEARKMIDAYTPGANSVQAAFSAKRSRLPYAVAIAVLSVAFISVLTALIAVCA